ncbi:MAG: hypothetical protein LJE84_11850 [Gammaproteobacteria bacterium]|jgi:cell division protein ZapB|nr:hypothetical protein [Gammaproteobacteria bacterium]
MLNDEMQQLESQLNQLLSVCQRLRVENSSLRSEQRELTRENARLGEKTRLARTRIEAIIGKLKSIEGRA